MISKEAKKKESFTLAETLITVVILGILAAILVPNLIKNQVENANRTKVKKAMAAYEKAINMMIIENDIKSTEALGELGQDSCQYTREYFKIVQDGSNNCIFKTADRVWWDITDITNPIISLKDEIIDSNKASIRANALNYNSDTTSFALVGRFDDLGALRINDNAYEQTYGTVTNQKYVAKLWYFITQSINALSGLDKCKLEGAVTCTVAANGVSTNYTKVITNTSVTVDTIYSNNKPLCIRYDKGICINSTADAGEYWISDNFGTITEDEAKDLTGSVCGSFCNTSGDYYNAAKRKCENSGGHLPTLAELVIVSNNDMLGSGWFWASEEYGTNQGAFNYASYYKGKGGQTGKVNTRGKVICVGN